MAPWAGFERKMSPRTEDYIACIGRGGPVAAEVRRLSAGERLGDALFMGLRLSDGIDLEAISQRYGVDVWQKHGAELERFLAAGILTATGRQTRLDAPGHAAGE